MIDVNHLLMQSVVAPIMASPIVLLLGKRLKRDAGWITLAPLAYSLICLAASSYAVYRVGDPLTASYLWAQPLGALILLLDGMSAPVAITIAVLGLLACTYSVSYMEAEGGHGGYFALYLLFISGMLGAVLSVNLAAFFIFFELMLIASWLLIAFWGEEKREQAALKYFIYTEAGALLLLAGIGVAYAATGTLNLLEIKVRAAGLSSDLISLTVSLMLIGFLVKMAIFPLHSWLPDAYTQSPTPITAIFSAMTGIGGYAAIRILYTGFPSMLRSWGFMMTLAVLALVTILYGGYMAFAQDRLKTLLAYSSMSQMGYLLFGIASQSIMGLLGALLIYVAHGFAKAILFMASGLLSKSAGSDRIRDLSGLAGRMRLMSIAFMIGFLSLMGFPPLLGFWGELLIFAGSIYSALSSSLDAVRLTVTLIAIIAAMITAGYGLWTIRRILFGEQSDLVRRSKPEPLLLLAPMLASALLLIIFGIQPTILTKLAEALA